MKEYKNTKQTQFSDSTNLQYTISNIQSKKRTQFPDSQSLLLRRCISHRRRRDAIILVSLGSYVFRSWFLQNEPNFPIHSIYNLKSTI